MAFSCLFIGNYYLFNLLLEYSYAYNFSNFLKPSNNKKVTVICIVSIKSIEAHTPSRSSDGFQDKSESVTTQLKTKASTLISTAHHFVLFCTDFFKKVKF